ncbi:MAG: Holliday junction branch migration protein RuvA [Acidobacteriota bacterium]|nr:MAG: Holliday junction branch migration protein RuvA [Acidobacteriota bacterium]
MIAYLKGRVVSLESGTSAASGQTAVLDVHGVGYRVRITTGLYASLKGRADGPGEAGGGEVALHVYSHATDGDVALFGFASAFERRVFERLLRVSGVGPSLALAALSAHRAEDLIAALASGDGSLLERVPRVGKKLASRILLELRDKLDDLLPEAAGAGEVAGAGAVWRDVASALVNMGYRASDAEAACRAARERAGECTFEDAFRAALKKAQGK